MGIAKMCAMVLKQISDVAAFLEGLVIYVLSREWHDMLTIYVFRLQPVPHCSEAVGVRFGFFGLLRLTHRESHTALQAAPTCTPEADAATQARCVLILVGLAAAVHFAAQRTLPAGIAPVVTSIAGTTLGWAAGDAAVKLLVETMPTPPEGSSGVEGPYDVIFACCTTLLAVLIMLLLEPFTVHALAAIAQRALEPCAISAVRRREWPSLWRWVDAVLDFSEDLLLAVAMLGRRAVTMVVLMVWV